jgi:hypothetical protein
MGTSNTERLMTFRWTKLLGRNWRVKGGGSRYIIGGSSSAAGLNRRKYGRRWRRRNHGSILYYVEKLLEKI